MRCATSGRRSLIVNAPDLIRMWIATNGQLGHWKIKSGIIKTTVHDTYA